MLRRGRRSPPPRPEGCPRSRSLPQPANYAVTRNFGPERCTGAWKWAQNTESNSPKRAERDPAVARGCRPARLWRWGCWRERQAPVLPGGSASAAPSPQLQAVCGEGHALALTWAGTCRRAAPAGELEVLGLILQPAEDDCEPCMTLNGISAHLALIKVAWQRREPWTAGVRRAATAISQSGVL